MGILTIQQVQREGARLLIMLAGVSGCGKTKTALELAYGMTGGDGSKVGFCDSENGRGKLYADEYTSPYLYGELKPPFSPERYVQAINEFAKTGIEVLVIDSGSHEWEGLGGCTDIAEGGNPRLPNWNKAKAEHKKFMSTLLNSPMHIILCLRAREKAKPEKQIVEGREKTVYVDLGLQPITERNVVFEATASLMLHDQGTRQDPLKVPAALQDILGRGTGYITQDDGAALRAWVDGAKQLDATVEHHRGLLHMAAEKGMAALQKQWTATPARVRKAINPSGKCPDNLKASATAFDEHNAAAAAGTGGTTTGNDSAAVDALNKAIAKQPDPAPATKPEPEPEDPHKPEEQPATDGQQQPAAPGDEDDGRMF